MELKNNNYFFAKITNNVVLNMANTDMHSAQVHLSQKNYKNKKEKSKSLQHLGFQGGRPTKY